jgi:hypothetical protein
MRRNESANAIPHFHRPLDKVITFSDLFIWRCCQCSVVLNTRIMVKDKSERIWKTS